MLDPVFNVNETGWIGRISRHVEHATASGSTCKGFGREIIGSTVTDSRARTHAEPAGQSGDSLT